MMQEAGMATKCAADAAPSSQWLCIIIFQVLVVSKVLELFQSL